MIHSIVVPVLLVMGVDAFIYLFIYLVFYLLSSFSFLTFYFFFARVILNTFSIFQQARSLASFPPLSLCFLFLFLSPTVLNCNKRQASKANFHSSLHHVTHHRSKMPFFSGDSCSKEISGAS